jgi:hypothetical protein
LGPLICVHRSNLVSKFSMLACGLTPVATWLIDISGWWYGRTRSLLTEALLGSGLCLAASFGFLFGEPHIQNSIQGRLLRVCLNIGPIATSINTALQDHGHDSLQISSLSSSVGNCPETLCRDNAASHCLLPGIDIVEVGGYGATNDETRVHVPAR